MNQEEIEKSLSKIPFPEHIFQNRSGIERSFFKRNWNGNPEVFIENCERSLGIQTEVIYEEDGHTPKSVKISLRAENK